MAIVRTACAAVAAAALVLPGVAAAQPPGERLPGDAVAVAGPTESGARLFVYDRGGQLCGVPRRPRPRAQSEGCGPPSPRLRGAIVAFHPERGRPLLVWGFVAPSVASVEIMSAGGGLVAADTTAGAAYRGAHAGRVRFFLAEAPRGAPVLYLRLLGADGTLLAAFDPTFGGGAPGRPVEVGRGQTVGADRPAPSVPRGLPWSLRALTRRVHTPLPGDEERVLTRSCVLLAPAVRTRRQYMLERVEVCHDPDFPNRPDYTARRSCDPIGIQVLGLVPHGTGRVVAILGDGSRRRLPVRRLPAGMGDRRAFALALARDVALRSLTVPESGRRRRLIGGIGPGLADCPGGSSDYEFGFGPPRPWSGPQPPALQLRDEGVLLCATLGLPDPRGRDCARPPLDELESRILWQPADAGTVVAGVVPAHVGSVELLLERAGPQRLPTTAETTYAGRYRGLVRVFSISFPFPDQLTRVTLNGLDGQPLASLPFFTRPSFERLPTPVLRARSGWRLGAGVVEGGLPCIQLVRQRFSRDPLGCAADAWSRQVRVTCRPKGMIVAGRLRPGVRTLDVVTSRGTFRARTASLGAHGLSGRAFLVELPGRAAPRAIVTRGATPGRQRLRLPAAARQCGYTEQVTR
jgi:hypothetical protein